MTEMIAIRIYGAEAPTGLPARIAVAQEREAVALRRAGWLHHQDIHPRKSLVSLPRATTARLVCEGPFAYVSGDLGRLIAELKSMGTCLAYQWNGAAWRRLVLFHLPLPDSTCRTLGLVAQPNTMFERLVQVAPSSARAATQRALASVEA